MNLELVPTEIGLNCIALLLGIKLLASDQARAIAIITREIESLASHPQPDAQAALQRVMSVLSKDEVACLRAVKHRINAPD